MTILRYSGRLLAGVDEVGRGPLAGDVVAAAVILDASKPVQGLADSKKLSEKKREDLYRAIVDRALCWHVGRASVAEIDSLNILQASLLAMRRAVEGLKITPEFVAVDGNRLPAWSYATQAIIGGDARVPVIGAASIIAKVTRDREMTTLADRYPGYGFAVHKGYGTPHHLTALRKLGPCPAHRHSFRPVRELVTGQNNR